MDTYGISFMDDAGFVEGHDFAFVVMPGAGWIFYRESTLGPESLEDSWAAYRALIAPVPPPSPLKLVSTG